MKRGRNLGTLVALIIVGANLAAFAELKENPYQVIIDRNPFGLRPIPPPPVAVVETNAPAPPPPDIKLTGITTLLGTARVMLQVEDKQTKKALFPTLAEGDSENGITIVKIDTENMKVRIKNGEAETTLDFKNNGVKPGGGIAASASPVPQPGLNLGAMAVPGAVPNPNMNAASSRGAIVSGGMTTPTPVPGVNYANNAAAANAYGAGNLPQRAMRTDNLSIVGGGAGGQVFNPNAPTVPQQAPSLSREEAERRVDLLREELKQRQQAGGGLPPGVPSPNILPPTPLSKALGSGNPTPPSFPR